MAASKARRDSGRACFSLHRSRRQKEALLVCCARLSVQINGYFLFFPPLLPTGIHEQQGNTEEEKRRTTTEFKMYITSECIAWHAVSVTESVIIVSVNLLTIIVFIRNKNLRKRSTCLVINLTVVDMLVGVLFGVPQFPFLPCNVFVDFVFWYR